MITEEQMELFTRWRVRAFGEMLREVCEGERYDRMSFEEKLGLCIDAEREARENRKIERCRRQAGFKIRDACVEGIVYSPDRSLAKDRMLRLASCRWVEERENLVIISESGCGKSYVSQALGVSACRRAMSVRYARLADMFRELNVARSEGAESLYRARDGFADVELLILDDFMTSPFEDPRSAIDLFEILEAREGRRSTLIASQLEPEQWYLRINSDLCADSILNRIVQNARFLDIKGPNMRKWMADRKAEEDPGHWD